MGKRNQARVRLSLQSFRRWPEAAEGLAGGDARQQIADRRLMPRSARMRQQQPLIDPRFDSRPVMSERG